MMISKFVLQAFIVVIGSLLALLAIALLRGADHCGDE